MQPTSALLDAVKKGRYRQAKLLVEAASATGSGGDSDANAVISTGVLDVDDVDASISGQFRRRRTQTPPLVATCIHINDDDDDKNGGGGGIRSRFARLLLNDARLDPNARDARGMTALMHAAVLGQSDVVLILLAHNDTNLELQDDNGNTALMHAAANGHADIVSQLLDQMGRLKQVLQLSLHNERGLTALELAELGGHSRVSTLLGRDQQRPGGFIRVGGGCGGGGDKFPAPGQLDRNPTPRSPYDVVSTSFPIRWQQRKTLERKLTHQQDHFASVAAAEDNNSGSRASLQSQSDTPCSLPRLAASKEVIKRHASKEDDLGQYLQRTSRNDMRIRKEVSQQLAVATSVDDARRSHSEPRNGSQSTSSSSTSSSSLDRFQQVLNVLDASINDVDKSRNLRDVDSSFDGVGGGGGGSSTGDGAKWNRGFEALKEYRFTKNLQGRYFPPIRPIQTTVSLPGDHKINGAWNAKKM